MTRDDLHDECEVVVRSIVQVDWQTIVLLVERELEIALGTTGADVLPGFKVAYISIPCGVIACHMCVMSHLVVLQFLVTEKGHTVVAQKSLSTFDVLSNGNSSKRYPFTLSRNCTR